MIQISVINESTQLSDSDAQNIVNALQIQVTRDFLPVWGVNAQLSFIPPDKVPANTWQLIFLDNADQAGALGYHDITTEGLPLGKVFVATTLSDGGLVSITASHECLEMLADPDINLCATVENSRGVIELYAYEVCDACEDDSYSYKINEVSVSDFVYPAWFESFRRNGPFDFQKQIPRPFQLLPGGYIGVLNPRHALGWSEVTSMSLRSKINSRSHIGSRRDKRRTPRENWIRSFHVGKDSPSKSPVVGNL